EDGCLCGVVTVVTLLQAEPAARLRDVYDDDPVRVGADTDVVDVAVLMSDYNLITVPVVDDDRTMIGLITVDDVLEVTLPDDWRRREAAEPPDSRRGRRAGASGPSVARILATAVVPTRPTMRSPRPMAVAPLSQSEE